MPSGLVGRARHRSLLPLVGATALLAVPTPASAAAAGVPARHPAYAPGEVVVGYKPQLHPAARAALARAVGAPAAHATGERIQVLRVAPGRVRATVARLRGQPGVAFAAPNPIAHASAIVPNDPGLPRLGGLEGTQWNFFGPWGVGAVQAWTNVAAGGRGVRIAVLDTGVAYRRWRQYRRSPDFARTTFVAPYDAVANTAYPVDRSHSGHGTHVAGTIAETPDNRIGVTGLAWGASIMPVRVLDSSGYGDAATIAKGIRYATRHGARVINLSLEFSTSVGKAEIPEIISAIRDADRRGAVVVASAGNDGEARIAYPARADLALSVGATTDDGCLASFSNDGDGLDIVAPGGGPDADLADDPNCRAGHTGRDIYQETYVRDGAAFGLPRGFAGTSMAAPHVSATAALVIASGVLGRRPTPRAVTCRLEATATRLGATTPNRVYGYGLVNAADATLASVQTPQCANLR